MKLSGKKVHFIGICGISLSALAVMAQNLGAIVSGSDLAGEDLAKQLLAKQLKERGIIVFSNHSKHNVVGAEIVVYSSAISVDNPELVFARNNGLKIFKRAEFLFEISKQYDNVIAISGCHGKTTTTAMISQIFIDAGLNPTVHIGGEFSYINGNVRIGDNKNFITEACEYKNNFLKLKPTVSVVLNVQPDHLDFFKNFLNVKLAFFKFLKRTKKDGIMITNVDDENIMAPMENKNLTFSMNNFGFANAVNVCEYDDGTFSFDLLVDGAIKGNIKLNVCGKHNIYNALASILVAKVFGINYDIIFKSLENFKGVDRRFQLMGKINKASVIIDYAHHPTEIFSSIETARRFTKGKIIAIFQPHTYSRTQAFFNEFIDSLSGADKIAFYSIYPARESPILNINNRTLCESAKQRNLDAYAINNYEELKKFIYENANPKNTILLLGAGDFVSVCNELVFD